MNASRQQLETETLKFQGKLDELTSSKENFEKILEDQKIHGNSERVQLEEQLSLANSQLEKLREEIGRKSDDHSQLETQLETHGSQISTLKVRSEIFRNFPKLQVRMTNVGTT